ncbi:MULTISPECIES: hypothetical protein [Roseomonadaceae]|nr:hypothetical protein [Roseomonas oleicola]
MLRRIALLALLFLATALPTLAQPTQTPPAEDCGCGVPSSPRGPR